MMKSDNFIAKTLLNLNAVLTGILLGIFQWGIFFLLQSYLASTAIVYLLATVVWLAGSVIGLALPGPALEVIWLTAALAAYEALREIAEAHLYDFSFLPVLLALVAVMGGYAGRFFRARAAFFAVPPGAALFQSSKWLFFLENTGFIAGMVAISIGLLTKGDSVLAAWPIGAALPVFLTAVLILWLRPPDKPLPKKDRNDK